MIASGVSMTSTLYYANVFQYFFKKGTFFSLRKSHDPPPAKNVKKAPETVLDVTVFAFFDLHSFQGLYLSLVFV